MGRVGETIWFVKHVLNRAETLLTSSITMCVMFSSAFRLWSWRRSTPVVQNNSLVEGQIFESPRTTYPTDAVPGSDSALSDATRDATPTAAKRRGWATIILVLSGEFSSMNWGICVVWGRGGRG